MSEELSGVFKRVIGRVRVDQHSRGIHFGSIGYLYEKGGKRVMEWDIRKKTTRYILSIINVTSIRNHPPSQQR